jgi:chromosome segregation ATPase
MPGYSNGVNSKGGIASTEAQHAGNDSSDPMANSDLTMIELKLAFLEIDKAELERNKEKLTKGSRMPSNETAKLPVSGGSSDAAQGKLQHEVAALQKEIKNLKFQLMIATSDRKEADHDIRDYEEKLDTLREENVDLTSSDEQLHAEKREIQQHLGDLQEEKQDSLKAFKSLELENTSLKSQVATLLNKSAANSEELAQAKDNANLYKREKNELTSDLESTNIRLTNEVAARERLEKEHKELVHKYNGKVAQANTPTIQATPAQAQLTTANKQLRDDIMNLQCQMAACVVEMDVAHAGFRYLSCCHEDLKNIRIDNVQDGKWSTFREMAYYYFSEWSQDETFMQEYINTRQYMIKHRRAHEKEHAWRGASSNAIRDMCG